MTRQFSPGKSIPLALLTFACIALLFSACSKDGRSNNNKQSAQVSGTLIPMSGGHVAIYLRDVNGEAIDTSEANAAPYSPKQTCGYCHDYHTIEEGYHFQQGADYIYDDYGNDHGMYAWALSPGMIGKW